MCSFVWLIALKVFLVFNRIEMGVSAVAEPVKCCMISSDSFCFSSCKIFGFSCSLVSVLVSVFTGLTIITLTTKLRNVDKMHASSKRLILLFNLRS